MKPAMLAWLACLGALALDAVALLLWSWPASSALLEGAPALHLMACPLFAWAVPRVLPAGHAYRGAETRRLALVLALVLPLLGMLGLLALLAPALWRQPMPVQPPAWSRLGVPELPQGLPPRQTTSNAWRSRNIQAILLNAPAHQTRLEALQATLKLPDATAAALLRKALRDSDEEVRLLAHALLSRKEKTLETQIHTLHRALEHQPQDAAFALHKALAWAYWQLALLDPPGRAASTPLMSFASEHAGQALALQPGDAGLSLLQGHILLRRQDWDAARTVFQTVAGTGLPDQHTRPWLAEMAFQQRRASLERTSGRPAGTPARLSAVQRNRTGDGHVSASV